MVGVVEVARAARDDLEKEPKPGSVTLSSLATAPWTASIIALSARSASALLSPAPSAMLSTSSDLFTLASECVRVSKKLNAFALIRQAFSTRRATRRVLSPLVHAMCIRVT